MSLSKTNPTISYAIIGVSAVRWSCKYANDPGYKNKLYLMVRLQSWSFRNVQYIFITTTTGSTLNRTVVSFRDTINGSNVIVQFSKDYY